MRLPRALGSALLAWICAAVCRPQAAPVIKSETRLVVVDVVVTDKKGAYVHDLTAKDFQLFDNNREQPLQSFSLESSAASRPDIDYMVVAFDDAGMTPSDQVRAHQAAMRFIDANAGPARRIAVAEIDIGLHIAQSFSDSAGRLKDAITNSKTNTSATVNTANGTPATADLGSRDRFLALISLASDLKAAPGRKAIILFTGNLTASSAQRATLAKVIDTCNRSNVAVYPVDVRDVSLPASFSAENEGGGRAGRGGGGGGGGRGGRGMRGNSADPDLAADPNGLSQQVLFALASGTGGFVIRNANELPSGLQKAGEEQGEYYALGFTPPDSTEEICHALKVKTDRGGLTLRARASYCTGGAASLISANPVDSDLAKRAASTQTGAIEASMQLPFFYTGADVARVHVVMAIQPGSLKLEKKQSGLHANLNILGIASTPGGEVGARFNDTLTLDFDEADQSWKQKPVRYQKEFKIAPGEYTLTVVFSAGGDSFGKLTRPLTIEPYQPGKLALSALALGTELRPDTDSAAASLFDDHTPLVINGVELIPTGSAEFLKADQPFCYFEAYPGAAGAAHTLRLRILNASGEAVSDSGDSKLEFPVGKTSVAMGVHVPVAALAPGSYRLEVTLTDAAGTAARRTAPFDLK